MNTIPSHQNGLTQNPSPNIENFHPSHQQALTYSHRVNRSGRTIQALQADHHNLFQKNLVRRFLACKSL